MKIRLCGTAGVVLAVAWSALAAGEPPPLPPCEPGYIYVYETQFRDVETYVCKLEPYTKKTKKWVYSCKESPFCIHKDHSGCFGVCGCPVCLGPFPRGLLVKKEIVVKEEQTTRCVAQKVTTQVPCIVVRKVPLCEALYKPGEPPSPAPP